MVRHHRERAGLTQGEVAEKINKALETVSSIERGKSAPSFETLSDLSDALNVPVREFFGAGDYDAKAGRNDPLVRLIDRIAGLGDDDIDWLDRLVSTALARKSRT
jgi:transcriptional regulator with XRE-family HTH domain